MKAVPAKYFAVPPYRAELFYDKTGWSGVMNANGFNCLTFEKDGKPTGQTITSLEHAEEIAREWNK